MAFTQGLLYKDGVLYEGTGLEEQSSIRKVKLETGEVLQKRDVPGQYFGEGIIVWKDRLLELTWKAEKGFIYDLATFTPKGEFPYPGEGWGLTTDGKRIIMSDGTAELRFWDPETLKETGRITVTEDGRPLPELNELEWVKGEIYANVWQTERIVRIDPKTGKVVGSIDCRGLLTAADRTDADRCPERHRLRRQGRPPVRHRQTVAQALRDQTDQTGSVGQAAWPVGHTPTQEDSSLADPKVAAPAPTSAIIWIAELTPKPGTSATRWIAS